VDLITVGMPRNRNAASSLVFESNCVVGVIFYLLLFPRIIVGPEVVADSSGHVIKASGKFISLANAGKISYGLSLSPTVSGMTMKFSRSGYGDLILSQFCLYFFAVALHA
jgi:hypothetical protein